VWEGENTAAICDRRYSRTTWRCETHSHGGTWLDDTRYDDIGETVYVKRTKLLVIRVTSPLFDPPFYYRLPSLHPSGTARWR
jgi:hypothetical protein